METKKCITCEEVKPVGEFYKRWGCTDKYNSSCKPCCNQKGKDNYAYRRKVAMLNVGK